MDAKPEFVTAQNWEQEPWPEGLAVFVQCKVNPYPNAGCELPCLPRGVTLWAGEFKLRSKRTCVFCQKEISPGQVAIQAALSVKDNAMGPGLEVIRYKTKWVHSELNDCKEAS